MSKKEHIWLLLVVTLLLLAASPAYSQQEPTSQDVCAAWSVYLDSEEERNVFEIVCGDEEPPAPQVDLAYAERAVMWVSLFDTGGFWHLGWGILTFESFLTQLIEVRAGIVSCRAADAFLVADEYYAEHCIYENAPRYNELPDTIRVTLTLEDWTTEHYRCVESQVVLQEGERIYACELLHTEDMGSG